MNIRVLYNVLLVRLGIRRILPSDYINGIKISENHDPMVQLIVDESLVKTDGNVFVGKKGMIERLLKAAKDVSDKGYRLHIYQTYRSPKEQAERRETLYKELRKKYPNYDEKAILQLVNKGAAGVGGGHQTGGAVDLSLCDKDGKELDMGTQYREFNLMTATHSNALNDNQRSNRMVLLKAMQYAGFVNYPAEWWHFCYGDKMWAAYSKKKTALYGIV